MKVTDNRLNESGSDIRNEDILLSNNHFKNFYDSGLSEINTEEDDFDSDEKVEMRDLFNLINTGTQKIVNRSNGMKGKKGAQEYKMVNEENGKMIKDLGNRVNYLSKSMDSVRQMLKEMKKVDNKNVDEKMLKPNEYKNKYKSKSVMNDKNMASYIQNELKRMNITNYSVPNIKLKEEDYHRMKDLENKKEIEKEKKKLEDKKRSIKLKLRSIMNNDINLERDLFVRAARSCGCDDLFKLSDKINDDKDNESEKLIDDFDKSVDGLRNIINKESDNIKETIAETKKDYNNLQDEEFKSLIEDSRKVLDHYKTMNEQLSEFDKEIEKEKDKRLFLTNWIDSLLKLFDIDALSVKSEKQKNKLMKNRNNSMDDAIDTIELQTSRHSSLRNKVSVEKWALLKQSIDNIKKRENNNLKNGCSKNISRSF